MTDPERYDAWYRSPRGAWIGERESALLHKLMRPAAGQSLLDVGSGTGYFSRYFASAGLAVTGMDPDPDNLRYARSRNGAIASIQGDARRLPFADNCFDYCSAVTSLCFISPPEQALSEMWRVSRRGVVLGLLNRNSLLYRQKHGSGAYRGARWDTWAGVKNWLARLAPPPQGCAHATAVFFPGGGRLARLAEAGMPGWLPWGGFLAVYLEVPR